MAPVTKYVLRPTSLRMGTCGEEFYYAITCSAVGGSGDLETELPIVL
jgi:hypothetical protein